MPVSKKRGNGECARCCMFHGFPCSCCLSLMSHALLVAAFPVPARPYASRIGGIPYGWDLRGLGRLVTYLMALKPGGLALKLTTSDLEKNSLGLGRSKRSWET